jgi:2-oxoglutarate dehydrogenase E2 component (dihydrolipoamide succinyltransferase)
VPAGAPAAPPRGAEASRADCSHPGEEPPALTPPLPHESSSLALRAVRIACRAQVIIRPMMYIALTYDHRLIDGREAVTALKRIKELIEDPHRFLLDV